MWISNAHPPIMPDARCLSGLRDSIKQLKLFYSKLIEYLTVQSDADPAEQ